MKKSSLLVFILVFVFNSFCQTESAIQTSILSDDFRFGGSMSTEIFEKLTSDEQKAYLTALDSLGLKIDSISWVNSDFIKQLTSETHSFTEKTLWINTKDFIPEIEIIESGKDHLNEPKCMLFFKRENGISYFTFQVYY